MTLPLFVISASLIQPLCQCNNRGVLEQNFHSYGNLVMFSKSTKQLGCKQRMAADMIIHDFYSDKSRILRDKLRLLFGEQCNSVLS